MKIRVGDKTYGPEEIAECLNALCNIPGSWGVVFDNEEPWGPLCRTIQENANWFRERGVEVAHEN